MICHCVIYVGGNVTKMTKQAFMGNLCCPTMDLAAVKEWEDTIHSHNCQLTHVELSSWIIPSGKHKYMYA